MDIPDVDLEVLDREGVVKLFPTARPASQKIDNRLVIHNNGVYFQDIPTTPDGLAALPFRLAETLGFYKIDLLTCPARPYEGLKSMTELRAILDEPIDWDWFTDKEFVHQLFHLGGVTHLGNDEIRMGDVVAFYAPKSIEDLACMVAIKNPGKVYLIGATWEVIRQRIWLPETKMFFKKSHSIAYAVAVTVHAKRLVKDFYNPVLNETDNSSI